MNSKSTSENKEDKNSIKKTLGIDLSGIKKQVEEEMPTDAEAIISSQNKEKDKGDNANIGEIDLLQDLLTKLKVAEKGQDLTDRTSDVTEFSTKKWSDLDLPESLLKAFEKMDYQYPSPVQYRVIKEFGERSMIVRAKNGTGKTASYLIPLIASIIRRDQKGKGAARKLNAIVLVPTRELALQVSKVAKRLARGTPIQVMATFGGTNLYEDILRLKKGVDIVVTTLGRIIDVLEKQVTQYNTCKTLVIDEADKLLSFEFSDPLDRIISVVQPERMMLLSATFPASVDVFVRRYLDSPIYINTMREIALQGVQQFYALVKYKEKLICLKTILTRINFNKCVIFCNSIKNVELLAQRIASMGYSHFYIHSQMTQAERNRVFHNFSEKNTRILVSSDLVTRGIDVPEVNCVINFDFPKSAESYVHRIGRSGRFGTRGISISLICDHETESVIDIERKLGIEMFPVSDERFMKYQKVNKN